MDHLHISAGNRLVPKEDLISICVCAQAADPTAPRTKSRRRIAFLKARTRAT
jgi:hypothetical protein